MSTLKPNIGIPAVPVEHPGAAPEVLRFEGFLWKLILLTALAYFIWSEKISIHIGPVSIRKAGIEQQLAQSHADLLGLLGWSDRPPARINLDGEQVDNLTFVLDPTYARRHGVPTDSVQQRMNRCLLFVKRFKPVAIAEMHLNGVPASILLAQALLASDAGDDPAVAETHNYFLRNCTAQGCSVAHYIAPESGDDPVMIDVFPNLWGSFRAQSLFMKHTVPYSTLLRTGQKDYHIWSKALDAAGYTDDEQYGDKVNAVIQALELAHYDQW